MPKNIPLVPSRRDFLKKTLTLIPLVATAGRSTFSSANTQPEDQSTGASPHYVPVYFNNEEWAFLLAACERLIPEDENGSGAVAQGVPVFIDRQMETPFGYGGLWYMQPPFVAADPTLGYQSKLIPREIYRLGIHAVNTHCQKQFNKRFAELDATQQDNILTELEKNTLQLNDVPGTLFFDLLLQNTKEGYFCDPTHGGNQTLASWKLIGFPGARADYTDWVNRPNEPYPQPPVSISSKRTA